MQKARIWIEIAAVLVVGIGAFFVGRMFPFHAAEVSSGVSAPTVGLGASVTRAPVPAGVTVPDRGQPAPDAATAVPSAMRPEGPNTDSQYRSFDVQIANDTFTPSTVVVYQGDVAHVNLTAVDKDYDFKQPDYGFYGQIPKGATRVIEAQFTTTGKFTFYCPACGGPTKGPVGYIIVVPK